MNHIHTFTSNVICSVHAGPEAGIGTFFPEAAAISNAISLNQGVIPMITRTSEVLESSLDYRSNFH